MKNELVIAILMMVTFGCGTVKKEDIGTSKNQAELTKNQIAESKLWIQQTSHAGSIVDCGNLELSENSDERGLELEFDPAAFIGGAAGAPAGEPVKLHVPLSRVVSSSVSAASLNQLYFRANNVTNSEITVIQEGAGGNADIKGQVLLRVNGTLEGKKVAGVMASEKQVYESADAAKAQAKEKDAVVKTSGIKNGRHLNDLFLVAPLKKK